MSFCAPRVVFRELLTLPICTHEGPSLIAAKCSRHYATHRDNPQPGLSTSSLLSQALDQKQRGVRREDTVGPFQLGLSQPSFNGGTAKKWSELSPKGKGQSLTLPYDEIFKDFPTDLNTILAMRATARTTNLTVILFGAGLTTVLVYALTSELFSKNSPTVLYNEACERIKSSPRVCKHSLQFINILKRTCVGCEISPGIISLP